MARECQTRHWDMARTRVAPVAITYYAVAYFHATAHYPNAYDTPL
jgi:hypothetical protein